MAIGWFIAQYKRRNPGQVPAERYCVIDDYTQQIFSEGGTWSESEVLGNAAIVKVRAQPATLTTIAADPLIDRIPLAKLDDPLNTLTVAQRNNIKNRVQALGYTAAEITAVLGNDFSVLTLGDVLLFVTQRRLKPRYDQATDTIIIDGPIQPVKPLHHVEDAVQ